MLLEFRNFLIYLDNFIFHGDQLEEYTRASYPETTVFRVNLKKLLVQFISYQNLGWYLKLF